MALGFRTPCRLLRHRNKSFCLSCYCQGRSCCVIDLLWSFPYKLTGCALGTISKTFWRTFYSSFTTSVDRDWSSCKSLTLWLCFRYEWHSSCRPPCITLYLTLCILLPLNSSSRTFICICFCFLQLICPCCSSFTTNLHIWSLLPVPSHKSCGLQDPNMRLLLCLDHRCSPLPDSAL